MDNGDKFVWLRIVSIVGITIGMIWAIGMMSWTAPRPVVLVVDGTGLLLGDAKLMADALLKDKRIVVCGVVLGGENPAENSEAFDLFTNLLPEERGEANFRLIIGNKTSTYIRQGVELFNRQEALKDKEKFIILIPSVVKEPTLLEIEEFKEFMREVNLVVLTPNQVMSGTRIEL